MNQFSFKNQLSIGKSGEEDFKNFYLSKRPLKAENRTYDFVISPDKTVELKTDTYNLSETGNFFFERFGNCEENKSGGPWRAEEDKIDYFVYYFVNNKTFFWFDTKKLVEFLDKNLKGRKIYKTKTQTWTSSGFLFKVQECLSVCMFRDDF